MQILRKVWVGDQSLGADFLEGVECTALAKVLSGWMAEIKGNVT